MGKSPRLEVFAEAADQVAAVEDLVVDALQTVLGQGTHPGGLGGAFVAKEAVPKTSRMMIMAEMAAFDNAGPWGQTQGKFRLPSVRPARRNR